MNMIKSSLVATVACAGLLCFGMAGEANAQQRQNNAQNQGARSTGSQCNPPPCGYGQQQWYRQCEQMLQYLWRNQNPNQIIYSEFVRMYWQMYEVACVPGSHPLLPGQPCSPEGSGYMNQSGHAQICRGGRWTVGGY
jgi:hypothetical protein